MSNANAVSVPLNKLTPMGNQGKFNIRHSQRCCVFVGNISYDCSEDLLFQLFNRIGGLEQFKILKDTNASSHRGYGFLEFNNEDSAMLCYKTLNGMECMGRPLRLDLGDTDIASLDMLGTTRQRDLADLQSQMIGPHPISGLAEAANKVLSKLSIEQLFFVIDHARVWAQNNPAECRAYLTKNPGVAYALQFAQFTVGMVEDLEKDHFEVGRKDHGTTTNGLNPTGFNSTDPSMEKDGPIDGPTPVGEPPELSDPASVKFRNPRTTLDTNAIRSNAVQSHKYEVGPVPVLRGIPKKMLPQVIKQGQENMHRQRQTETLQGNLQPHILEKITGEHHHNPNAGNANGQLTLTNCQTSETQSTSGQQNATSIGTMNTIEAQRSFGNSSGMAVGGNRGPSNDRPWKFEDWKGLGGKGYNNFWRTAPY